MKTAGIWKCTVLAAKFGEVDGKSYVTVTVEITNGPDKGQRCSYEEEVTAKQGPYILRTARAVGWAQKSLTTIAADCAAWIARTGGASTVEIKRIEIKRGPKAGSIWDKVNSIGRSDERALAAATPQVTADADDVMRRAMADEGGAPAGTPPADDDIPFCTADMAHDVSPIARVLR